MSVRPAILVSGFNRSGTSLMMDTLRRSFGDDAIMGTAFPQLANEENELKKRYYENDYQYEYRKYCHKKKDPQPFQEKKKKAEDANPHGFYEGRWTLRGLSWFEGLHEHLNRQRVAKVVMQALPNTDPTYVDRIILMLRHPKEIARSFERIGNGENLSEDELKRQAVSLPMPINYIEGATQAARWLAKHDDIPVRCIDFEALLAGPDSVLSNVAEFCGADDFFDHNIEPKLHRAKVEHETEDTLWQVAINIYRALLVKDYDAVLEQRFEASPYIRKEREQIMCARCGMNVSYYQCRSCYVDGNESLIQNYKAHAEHEGVDWRNEPCGFECGFAIPDDLPDEKYKSIEESVAGNHWKALEKQEA